MFCEKNSERGKNEHLLVRNIDIMDLCQNFGTPLFVFDEKTLILNLEKFRTTFEKFYPNVKIFYSIKTNNNLSICKIFRDHGAYAEVSSELDLDIALKVGFPGDRIIFDGPFKQKEVLKKAINANVSLINVESIEELKRLNFVAGELEIKQSVGIRINTFTDAGFSKYTKFNNLVDASLCNLESRFGFSVEEALRTFELALDLKNLNIECIMAHPYYKAPKILLPIMHKIREKFGVELKYLNIGGGFDPGNVRFLRNSDYILDFLREKIGRKSKLGNTINVPNTELIIKSLVAEIKGNLEGLSEPTLIVEPGRFLTSSAGILLTQVDHVKKAGGYNWAMVDAGTNLLPRFSAIELRKIGLVNKRSEVHNKKYNIVGPLLFKEDFLELKVDLPVLNEGDILSISDCGAYTLSRSNQFLHTRPKVVLIRKNDKIEVIREKETSEDYVCKDKLV